MAAVLACGRDAILSHMSAAALHGVLSSTGSAVDVTVERCSGRARSGIRVHRSTCHSEADRAVVGGIPCTSVGRTLLDLAAVVPLPVLEKACDQAEVLRLLDWSALDELLIRAGGRWGVRNLRAALRLKAEDEIPRSELERRFLTVCRRAGLPSPAVNEWLTVAGEEMQVDFVWRDARLVVETDGFRTHRTRQAFQRDRRRDRLLGLAGWRVVRFTWEDVTGDPEDVTRVLRELLLSATIAR
jgi:very-short-patch-repair endonuclease